MVMNIQRILYIYIILLGLLLTSCSSVDNENKIKIGFSQCISDHEWRRSMNRSIKLQASLHPEIDLVIHEADRDLEKQKEHIEKMLDDGTDVIIVSPIEQSGMEPVIAKAYEKGIPVILIDRKIASEKFSAYIGADNLEVGRNAGKYIASTEKGAVNIIEIRGRDNSSSVMERSIGFNQIVNQESRLNLLGTVNETNEGVPKQVFSSYLEAIKRSEIDYVYASNDALALQAWQIAKEKGLEKSIKFIGVDGLNGPDGGIQLVQDGILDATILYPTGGNEVIELAIKLLKKERIPKNNILTTTVIDKLNADIMKNQIDKINDQQNEIEIQLAAINEQEELYYAQNNMLKLTMGLLAIILSLMVYSIYSVFTIRKKNRQLVITNKKITVQRNQIQKIAEEVKRSNEAKLNFFTGVSHEFKTPLTLIMSSVESLRDIAQKKGYRLMTEIELIYNNSNRLLRLINQLLDFRKMENRRLKLKASKTNVYTFIRRMFNDFEQEAKKRSISFNLECENKQTALYLDRDLMDKVFYNLLSNAFKFTPDNGKITIIIDTTKTTDEVSIHFRDTGIGIPKSEIKRVFQAFYQGSNNQKSSSGIGLHLSKNFVELHGGTITLASFQGTEVKVTLKKGSSHLPEDAIVIEKDIVDTGIVDFESEYVDDSYLVQKKEEHEEKYTVLCVEDNKDLSLFLHNKLMHDYDMHLSDGTNALEIAFDIIPDVVICDINLPDQNGFELCEILKNDLRTSHIPIIILTALSDQDSYVKGLASGTDLFITKPFSYTILLHSIKSLMFNREKLRFYYLNNLHKIAQNASADDLEHRFINKLNTIIKENFDNSDFSIEVLADQMNISRVQLYRKVKAIMGVSVIDYVNNIKLEKSRFLLENTDLSISEVAYSSGFASSNYFSRTFKNKYGITPMGCRNATIS